MTQPWNKTVFEVRWLGDRRRKAWVGRNDLRDPVLVITLHGNELIPRRELEFINVKDPAEARQSQAMEESA